MTLLIPVFLNVKTFEDFPVINCFLSGLRTLNLSGNALSHLEDKNFDGLGALRHLLLDNNKIR
jgi:hypothetical protein